MLSLERILLGEAWFSIWEIWCLWFSAKGSLWLISGKLSMNFGSWSLVQLFRPKVDRMMPAMWTPLIHHPVLVLVCQWLSLSCLKKSPKWLWKKGPKTRLSTIWLKALQFELFNSNSVECEPPIVVKSRRTNCKDPLWEAANEYEPCSPGIEIADSILECAKIIPRDSSDPARSLHPAFDMVKDHKGESGIKGKRPFQDHDTWGLDSFREEPDFHESKVGRFCVDHDMWLRDMEKKLFDTGVARIWPMTRMVLFVNALNHWNVLIPVEYQLSVMGMFKKILPHAIPQNFQGVQVNGQEVCPGSIPAGLGKLVISFLPLECQVPIVFMNGEVKSIGCDVTTTCEELIQKICEGFGLHSSSFRIVCDDLPISRKSFVLGFKDGQRKIVKAIFVKLPSDVPTVYSPVDFTIPPKHSDVFVPAPMCSIRMAARHPVGSTVRTVSGFFWMHQLVRPWPCYFPIWHSNAASLSPIWGNTCLMVWKSDVWINMLDMRWLFIQPRISLWRIWN